MNKWTALVWIVGLVVFLVMVILIFIYFNRKLNKDVALEIDKMKKKHRLNNLLIKNNKIKSNCNPVSYDFYDNKTTTTRKKSQDMQDIEDNVIYMISAMSDRGREKIKK